MQNEVIKQQQEETISAVCTALGEGAIGIVRISGEKALACGEQLFKAASGKALGSYNPNTLVYGHVVDEDGAVIDEVMAVYMRAPHARASFLHGRGCCRNTMPRRRQVTAKNFGAQLCRGGTSG